MAASVKAGIRKPDLVFEHFIEVLNILFNLANLAELNLMYV